MFISPCLCLSLALASFLLYLDIPALLSLGFGPLFFGPLVVVPSSESCFLECLNLYLHLAVSKSAMSVSAVDGDGDADIEDEGDEDGDMLTLKGSCCD